jgi:hypothetical protein
MNRLLKINMICDCCISLAQYDRNIFLIQRNSGLPLLLLKSMLYKPVPMRISDTRAG